MNLKLGSHVSMSGKSMLLGSAKEAESYGANTFMFYTGTPKEKIFLNSILMPPGTI